MRRLNDSCTAFVKHFKVIGWHTMPPHIRVYELGRLIRMSYKLSK